MATPSHRSPSPFVHDLEQAFGLLHRGHRTACGFLGEARCRALAEAIEALEGAARRRLAAVDSLDDEGDGDGDPQVVRGND
jgi:hypothetical protein